MDETSASLSREWEVLQSGIDACSCQNHSCFDVKTGQRAARPLPPTNRGGLLLLAEAPPPEGGFWNARADDDLRLNLLGMLTQGSDALAAFLNAGFSLVHTLKWPLVRRAGKRLNYVRLKPKEKREMVEHAVTHLRDEIRLLKPRAILAMGAAAWHASLRLTSHDHEYPDRVEAARERPPHDYSLVLDHPIPLHVTLLPVAQNVGLKKETRMDRQGYS